MPKQAVADTAFSTKFGPFKMVALTASMRKLLCIMNAMLKNEQYWQPNLIENG